MIILVQFYKFTLSLSTYYEDKSRLNKFEMAMFSPD